MSYIELKECTKVIKKNIILDNINLSLDKGKTYGFMGPNGSGKTMLFRAICGLIKLTAGSVQIDDKIIRKDIDFPESCGVIIETPGFWDDLTGFECLKIIADIKKVCTKEDIYYWMERMGLEPKSKKLFGKYSLGMKQKLALIQALMETPDLIILDEPTNSLDEKSKIILKGILTEEKQRGVTILLSSHNKEDLVHLCDHYFRVENGKLFEVKDYENDN